MKTTAKWENPFKEAGKSLDLFTSRFLKALIEQLNFLLSTEHPPSCSNKMETKLLSSLILLQQLEMNHSQLKHLMKSIREDLLLEHDCSDICKEIQLAAIELVRLLTIFPFANPNNRSHALLMIRTIRGRYDAAEIQIIIMDKTLDPPWRPPKFRGI